MNVVYNVQQLSVQRGRNGEHQHTFSSLMVVYGVNVVYFRNAKLLG